MYIGIFVYKYEKKIVYSTIQVLIKAEGGGFKTKFYLFLVVCNYIKNDHIKTLHSRLKILNTICNCVYISVAVFKKADLKKNTSLICGTP